MTENAQTGPRFPAARTLLRRCLERNVRNRLRDIGEARVILTEVAEGKQDSGRPAPAPASRTAWIIAALAFTASLCLFVALWHSAGPSSGHGRTLLFVSGATYPDVW